MGGFSSVASVAVHAAVGVALFLGTTKSAHTDPIVSESIVPVFFEQPVNRARDAGIGLPAPDFAIPSDLPTIPFDAAMLQSGASAPVNSATSRDPRSSAGDAHGADLGGLSALWSEGRPEVLAGPLPTYPDLLRQSGIEGQVILEALVDSTGRVQARSVVVVSASNPGFVEPARQALIATLFRPARINGRAVSTLVRVPFAFSIRGGIGRAR